MKKFLRWSISNTPAMNMIMLVVLGFGLYCGDNLRRETFPNFDLEMISVSVPYPGATPDEVEEGICQKIEEAVRTVEGIKKITSTASESSGSVLIELRSDVPNVDRTLNEIRGEVDRIPSFPELAEDYDVKRAKMQETILNIGVLGPPIETAQDELALREVAERIRDDLLLLPAISQVNLVGSKNYQVDIEIPEATLRSYGLSLREVSNIVRKENCKRPGGTIRARSQEINVRTDNQRYHAKELAELPIVSQPGGSVLKLGDLGFVRDEFVDSPSQTLINGKPGIALAVQRNTNEDLLEMVDQLKAYAAKAQLPEGYSLLTWGDRSVHVRQRLDLLIYNGLQGLLIVFILLTLFLDIRLAFWVAMGIPFSVLATCLWLYFTGETLNMLSMFAMIMALGIVVDDAIVIGENIFSHRKKGKPFFQAAVDGTAEVFPSVAASVTTTVIAFLPLLFVSGIMGKFVAVLPAVVIAMLVGSLFECVFILPCHLAHRDSAVFSAIHLVFYVFSWVVRPIHWLNQKASQGMDWFIRMAYFPALGWVLRWRSVFLAGNVALLLLGVAAVRGGLIPFVFFPKIDSSEIQATVSFPNGTPAAVTDRWTRHIEDSFWRVIDQYDIPKEELTEHAFRVVGMKLSGRGRNLSSSMGGGSGHFGSVEVALVDGDRRSIPSSEIIRRWREEVGVIPGAEEVAFEVSHAGPGGVPIEFKLRAKKEDAQSLHEAVERCKTRLAEYPGVFDISDSDVPGKWEFRLRIKEDAYSMGVRPDDLANTVRAIYFGDEVMRIQRGRHEVKIMVCYPREDRRSLANFNEIRVQTPDGTQRPITELADIEVVRGYSTITRHNQLRAITIKADVNENTANASEILGEMRGDFFPDLLAELPGVSVFWEGQQERRSESFGSMLTGFLVALLGMYILLSMEFRSYLQPILILIIIPFGAIGAIAGHGLMGFPICFFSVFGLVALSGIVINDSIVLIDFVNMKIREGVPLTDAITQAGTQRFRPVVLTSTTTVGGLLPIMTETSLQAQLLIPMAISIAFGVLFAMVLVLFLIPVLYSLYAQALGLFHVNVEEVITEKMQSEEESAPALS